MVDRKPLEQEDMEAVDRRIVGMGRELYRLLEDYPALQPPDWSYVDAIMFFHQMIYDEAMKLKKAAIAEARSGVKPIYTPSGARSVLAPLPVHAPVMEAV